MCVCWVSSYEQFVVCIYVVDDAVDETVNGSNSSGSGRVGTVCYPILPICLPCWPGCGRCEDGAPCWVQEDRFLRAVVLAVQGFFMLLVFISMLVAYQFRRSRVSEFYSIEHSNGVYTIFCTSTVLKKYSIFYYNEQQLIVLMFEAIMDRYIIKIYKKYKDYALV